MHLVGSVVNNFTYTGKNTLLSFWCEVSPFCAKFFVCMLCDRLKSSYVLWRSKERFMRSAWSWSRTVRSNRRRSRKSSWARASLGPSFPSRLKPRNETAIHTFSPPHPCPAFIPIQPSHNSCSSSYCGTLASFWKCWWKTGVSWLTAPPHLQSPSLFLVWRGVDSSPSTDLTAPSSPFSSKPHRWLYVLVLVLFWFLGILNFWCKML